MEKSNNNDSKYNISLPNPVVNELKILENDKVFLKVENHKILMELEKDNYNKTVLLSWILLPTIIASIIFFIFFKIKEQPQILLTGDLSISFAVITLGLLSGVISFLYFFIKKRREKDKISIKDIYWRNFPTVVLSFTIITFLSLLIFFKILNELFLGVSFDIFTATILFFLFVSIVNYAMIFMAVSITPKLLTNALIFVIIGGVITAMITNSDQQWWQYNFSFLGGIDAIDS